MTRAGGPEPAVVLAAVRAALGAGPGEVAADAPGSAPPVDAVVGALAALALVALAPAPGRVALLGRAPAGAWAARCLERLGRLERLAVHVATPFRGGPLARRLAEAVAAPVVPTGGLGEALTGAGGVLVLEPAGLLLDRGMLEPGAVLLLAPGAEAAAPTLLGEALGVRELGAALAGPPRPGAVVRLDGAAALAAALARRPD